MTMHSHHFSAPGQLYHGFKLTKVVEIPEIQCVLRELIHEKSGAQVMHIANEDPENLFCLSFRTLPDSSNGVAHILEHTVLCGSAKYPVKDPFFAMGRRSLNTFMNAFTGSDFTCYPAASQVKKDFYNLLEVYVDAVFKPTLSHFSFLQEGHRLEFANPADATSPLEFKGVVFNEMKGALSAPNERLGEFIGEALFPNITYGFNSGGNPKDIPNLTYHGLKDFHRLHYHPGRCLFFFYGNLPLEEHLDFIAEHALNGIEPLPPLPTIPAQPRFSQPVYKTLSYPIAADEDPKDKTFVALGWLTCSILSQEELLALNVLDIALMGTDASPLKMALLKSGLCKQADSDIDEDISEVPYVLVLRGCNPGKAEHIEKFVRMTLSQIVEEGIPLESIESAIHQLELFRTEITGNSAPFGLSLFMRSSLLKQHGGKPEDGLMVHSLFNRLRETILRSPRYLESLIEKYFINNTHFVRIEMTPDKELASRELQEERLLLDNIRKHLSKKEEKNIIDTAAQLAAFQEEQKEVDEDILPKVTLEDVPKHSRNYPLTREKIGNLDVFHHACFTNKMVYADLVVPFPNLAEEDLPYARLFTVLLTQIGSGGRDYTETLDYIIGHTGGIGSSLALHFNVEDSNKYVPSLHLKGKALHRKSEKLFKLMLETATSANFNDVARIKELIYKHYVNLQSSLSQGALRYAINLSASQLNSAAALSQHWHGLSYYWKIREISENLDAHIDAIILKMNTLKEMLFGMKGCDLVLTCDSALYDELKGHHFYGLTNMDAKPYAPWKGEYASKPVPSQGRIIASPVAFIAHVFPTISYLNPDTPALSLAAGLFDNLVLHVRIREQGGAYGSGATNNAMSGNFYFFSYRDPHIASSLAAFQEALKTILDGDFEESDLEEAKLEIIQGLDSPVAPGSRGDVAYSWYRSGKTPEIRQAYREKLLGLTRQDVIDATRRQIAANIGKGSTVIFAGKDLLEKENATLLAKGLPIFPIEPI